MYRTSGAVYGDELINGNYDTGAFLAFIKARNIFTGSLEGGIQ
jgi:hypothetical protein